MDVFITNELARNEYIWSCMHKKIYTFFQYKVSTVSLHPVEEKLYGKRNVHLKFPIIAYLF